MSNELSLLKKSVKKMEDESSDDKNDSELNSSDD